MIYTYLKRSLPFLFAFVAGSIFTAWASAAPPGAAADVLIDTDTTILGQPFEYPQGRPKITAAIVTVPPHTTLKRHHHPVPLVGYILQGELIVDYGEAGERTYSKGDVLVEAFNTPHQGRNGGKGNIKILVIYAGAEGVPNTVLEES
jgi:quercetin dioxygenase-like cupin family protein